MTLKMDKRNGHVMCSSRTHVIAIVMTMTMTVDLNASTAGHPTTAELTIYTIVIIAINFPFIFGIATGIQMDWMKTNVEI